MSQPLLRTVAANYTRAKEAVRVVEDICRFYLKSSRLTGRLKRLRHDLTKIFLTLGMPDTSLIEARNSREDVGRRGLVRDKKRPGWKDLLLSNFKRAEEAVRVLEECSKVGRPSQTARFQRLRFRLYELEKESLRKF